MSAVTVIVCGARDWTNRSIIRSWLAKLPAGSVVVHGACGKRGADGRAVEGADLIAGEEAEALGFAVHAFPAEWEKHGTAAGPIRNQHMLAAADPDLVLAFTYVRHDNRGRKEITTGTADMVSRALEAGVRCTIVPRPVLTAKSLTAKPGGP